jgi:tRNA (guanine9-N1)-methyltransferase
MSNAEKKIDDKDDNDDDIDDDDDDDCDDDDDSVSDSDSGDAHAANDLRFEGKTRAEVRAMKAHDTWKKKRAYRREKEREKKRRAVAYGDDAPQKKVRNVRWNGEAIDVVWARDFVLPNVVVDCKFAAQLTDKEGRSLRTQICYLYGFMRRIERPCHVWIANLEESMRQLIFRMGNASAWPMHFHAESVLELFPPDKHRIVYLSPDATDALDDVVADTVYVIGGIVDRNRLKHATRVEAEQLGIRSARLPIFETVRARMNNSLNVNHVYEILHTQSVTHDWRKTFETCLPKRVFAVKSETKKETT